MEDFLVLEYMDLFFKKRRFSIGINYTMVAVIMLFVILISIQFTLNKIFMILKEIKEILINKNIKDENNERIRKY